MSILKSVILRPVKRFLIGVGRFAICMVVASILWQGIDFVCSPIHAFGESMMPTIKSGTWFYNTIKVQKQEEKIEFQRGDCIAFTCPGREDQRFHKNFLKRIVALPGDTVQIKDGYLYINEEISEFNFDQMENAGMFSDPVIVPDDQYVALGDNRNDSNDSRFFGFVPYDHILYFINLDNEWSLLHLFTFKKH